METGGRSRMWTSAALPAMDGCPHGLGAAGRGGRAGPLAVESDEIIEIRPDDASLSDIVSELEKDR
jgi:hypothetical protein